PVAALGIDCDPDVVLTLGAISHAALASLPALSSVRFIKYGSHRHAGPKPQPRWLDRPRRCLVLPDASHSEFATFVNSALECPNRRPDVDFVSRPHPMSALRLLLRRLPQLRGLPGNASLSLDKPLEQEFAAARYCLYRGSSAALH